MYITDMYEAYCTYVDDKYFDNHDYDDDTDADTDNDTGYDTDDDINTHIIVRSGYPAGHPAGHPVLRKNIDFSLVFHCFLGVPVLREQRERRANAGAAPPLWDSFNL